MVCLTKDFRKFLESYNTLIMLLKYHQHPHDKSDLGFEKEASSSKSQFDPKCDFYGKFGHSKCRCIHKKKQMLRVLMFLDLKIFGVPKSHIIPIVNIIGRKRPRFKLVHEQRLLTTPDGGKVYVPRPKVS